MIKNLLLALLICFILVGCTDQSQISSDEQNQIINNDAHKIPYPSGIVLEGAAGVERQFDVPNSPYYPTLDFFNMRTGGSLTILENFRTFQQTTEVTCGPATVIMVAEYYGMFDGRNYRELYELRANHERPQTMLRDLMTMFEVFGDWNFYSTFDLEDPYYIPMDFIITTLRAGRPIIIGDDEWGGHWRIIIGYDDMGSENTDNHVLILAEPYDTTDHNQDGYMIMSFDRLYYNWSNRYDPDFTHNVFLVAWPK
jgi:hypothetical protein